jgi:CRISPR-associated protein Cas2
MSKRRLYLVAYDISAPGTRARALKICKAHGLGGQKSAHECLLTERERSELEEALAAIIDPESDRLMIQRVGTGPEMLGLGQAEPAPEPPWFYVG